MRNNVISCVICCIIIITAITVKVPKNVRANVTEEWVARYNDLEYSHDYANDMAIDKSGNIYVTGWRNATGTTDDYVTVAYNPNGIELWVAKYNGPANGRDYAYAIATEPSGNIYVTGQSEDDYLTIAYDSSGNELWTGRYDGPVKGYDVARAIACDSNGNVYVTGYSTGDGWNADYATVAYDTSGNELWIARYNGLSYDDDFAYAIAVDYLGNVYVTGWSEGNGTAFDYATVSYDSLGNERWVARYNGPGNMTDYSQAVATDSLGNVYVTGRSLTGNDQGTITHYDYVTIAYNLCGEEQWTARYNDPNDGYDSPTDIVADSSGNVYVTGISDMGESGNYTTIAYDRFGYEQWVKSYNGPGNGSDRANAMTLGSSGNIYITGYSRSIDTDLYWLDHRYDDIATIAYDSSGNELWVARYNGPGNNSDWPIAIAIGPSEEVYVTGGSFANETSWEYVTIKYSQKIIQEPLETTINIDPDTLNLKSKGKWVTCYITLNDPYDVSDIDISSILLEDTIPAEWGDIQGDTLMVKFDRSEVEDILSPGTYNLKVTGELTDGTAFEGFSDEIRVIEPP